MVRIAYRITVRARMDAREGASIGIGAGASRGTYRDACRAAIAKDIVTRNGGYKIGNGLADAYRSCGTAMVRIGNRIAVNAGGNSCIGTRIGIGARTSRCTYRNRGRAPMTLDIAACSSGR